MEKKTFFIILILGIISLILFNFVSPILINTLSGNQIENLTFTEAGNITRNLFISRYVNVTSLVMNLSGYNHSCFQESANVSTSCGGLSTGNYSISSYYLYINYSKPINALNSSLWVIKLGNDTENRSMNLPIDCWDYSSSKLLLRVFSSGGGIGSIPVNASGECYNGTNWKIVTNTSSYIIGANCGGGFMYPETYIEIYDGDYSTYSWYNDFINIWTNRLDDINHYNCRFSRIYEESMIWNIPYPSNVSLSINNTQIWNFTGEFNQTNNKTSNFASTLNTALNNGKCDCSGCSLSGNNCTIPFTFHSDTAGILQYSDIQINYDSIPFVYLISPSNSSYSSSTKTFTCNSTDETNLANVTLYIWNSTSVYNNTNFFSFNKTQPSIENNMLLYYKLDNNSAIGENDTFIVDSGNYKNNATAKGTVNNDGYISKGFSFDGTDGKNITTINKINLTNTGFTLTGWAYLLSNSYLGVDNHNIFLSEKDNSGYGITLFQHITNRRLQFHYRNSSLSQGAIFSTSSMANNKWNHFAVSYNLSSNNFTLFLNGINEASVIIKTTPLENQIIFGKEIEEWDSTMNGTLDEILVYNRSLSSSEINEIYNNYTLYSRSTTFNLINFSRSDTYRWNCLAYNNNSYKNWYESNYTLIVDTSSPVITLNYPTNNLWLNNGTNINFNCTVEGNNLDSLFLYGNFSGTYSLNKTKSGITSGTINTFLLNLTDNQYLWTCGANKSNDATIVFSQYGNYTLGIDTIKPVMYNMTITTTINSNQITFLSNVTDINLNSCKYSIWTGSTPGTNTSFTCNSNTIATAPGFGTYKLFIYATDLANNENSQNLSFTTSISSGTTITGGGATTPEKEEVSKEFSILNTNLENKINLKLAKSSVRPREKTIILINRMKKPITIELSCDQTDVNKSSREIDVCAYIKFPNQTLILSANEENPTESSFFFYTPSYSDFREKYYANIIATEKESKSYSKLSLSSDVSLLATIFYKYSYYPFQSDIPDEEKSAYPVFLLALIVGIIVLIGSIAIFQRANLILTGLLVGFALFFASIILITLLI